MTPFGPLADLHRHLDGSLRRATLMEWARADGVPVREDLCFQPGMGLEAALERFRTTLSVLRTPKRVRRVAAEICQDAAVEGVTTLEIRFAPQLHPEGSLAEIVDAAVTGADGRAGIILCALYGDPPSLIEELVELAASRPGVVGIDLAGGPDPGHAHVMDDYRPAFERAAELGIGRTVHAGEGRPPAEIRAAITRLHATRIGHGTSLLEDPAVAELVRERKVTIEACPTSNWHTGAIPEVAAHPLPLWLEQGINVCVNTDNTLLSDVTPLEEHRRALAIPGMTPELLQRAIACGHRAAFSRT